MKNLLKAKNIGWILSGMLALVLIGSAFGKFTAEGDMLRNFESANLQDWIIIIGIGELVAVLLFMIPATYRIGTLLLSSYFGGAILFHMGHPLTSERDFTPAVVILLLVWVAAWLRGFKLLNK